MFAFKRLAGSGVGALTLSLLSTTAVWAAPVGFSAPVPFATQSVPATGAATIPVTVAPAFANTFTAACPAGTTVTEQFTLPGSTTFAGAITAVASGAFTAGILSPTGGGAPTGNVSFTATCTGAAGAGIVTLGGFSVLGATQLTTPLATSASGSSAGFAIGEQVTAMSAAVAGVAVGDKASTGLANAFSAFGTAYGAPGIGSPAIDSAALARQFQQPAGSPDLLVADLGTVTVFTVGGLINAQTGLAFTFGSAPAKVTVTGNFLGITNAYLQKGGATSCAGTATPSALGTIQGAISNSNTITFNNDVLDSGGQEICLAASGTAILSASGAVGISEQITVSGAITTVNFVFAGYTYTGGFPFQIVYTGNNVVYPGYVRIVNNGTTAVQVFAVTQGDFGSLGTSTVETALAANNNDTVPIANIIATSGVTPGPNGRVSMILVGSTANVVFTHLLGEPTPNQQNSGFPVFVTQP